MINNLKVLCIIQARMSSNRLPKKALADLNGKPAIIRMIQRVKKSQLIDKLVLATGKSNDNDVLEKLVKQFTQINVFRGENNDVLSRFVDVSKKYRADIIVRLTGDCPLIDPELIDKAIQLLIDKKADYVSNILKRTYPDGLDVEVFNFDTLLKVDKISQDSFSKEHVTTYMHGLRRSKNNLKDIKKISLENSVDFSNLRWTLDEEKDLDFLNSVFKGISEQAKWQDIISFLMNNPGIQLLNKEISLNEGAKKNNKNSLISRYKNSNKLFKKSIKYIPLGSQTFSKSYMQWPKGVAPLYIDRARGAKIIDIDGNDYIDYVLGLLPISLGYCDYDVDLAVMKQVNKGSIYSMPSKLETELAEKLVEIIPSAEMVRFGKNGSDVTTAAIRLARAYTGKELVAVSGYHGWHDWYIGTSSRDLGVPKSVKKLTKKFVFNDLNNLISLIKKFPNKFAAVIVEPAGLEVTDNSYLKNLKNICKREKIILIFDEIISGFRIDIGGAQKFYGVVPDISCFGKSMANGYPLSALVGKRKIMKLMEEIFFSSTFGGETISLAASIATISKMQKLNTINKVKINGRKIIKGISKIILNNNMEDYITISDNDWWPKLIINSPLEDESLFISLLRQEFLKNGLMLSSTFNLCYEHSDSNILKNTFIKFEKSLIAVKSYVYSKNPRTFLKGDLIQTIFKVR